MNTEKPLHIVSLTAENVKRLQAVTIRPNGEVVLIGGQNAQGKTSLLDSIEMALGGGKTIPVEPVRRGSRKARIVVDLGEIVVERTFSPKGTALEIRNAEGVPVKSPQSLLDKLCAKVAFDPLGFAREEPKKQDEILKQVLGVDFSQLDAKREALFAKRRDVKRDAKQLEARLDAMVQHAGVPAEEVSVAALTTELEHLRDQADENRKVREQLEQHRVDHSKAKTKVAPRPGPWLRRDWSDAERDPAVAVQSGRAPTRQRRHWRRTQPASEGDAGARRFAARRQEPSAARSACARDRLPALGGAGGGPRPERGHHRGWHGARSCRCSRGGILSAPEPPSTNTTTTLNARFCVAVVALDEDGNEVATLWPLDDAGKQWATSSKHAFTDDECKAMSRHAVGVLERLRKHWVELAREAL